MSKFRSCFLIALSFFIFTDVVAEPANLGSLKKELYNYHDSGLYDKELVEVLAQANNYIIQETLINSKQEQPKKLAIVLDIDETCLSNYNKMIKRDFASNPGLIHQEILEADLPAITYTLALYNMAIERGIKVFFITGRPLAELKATQLNLIKAGYKKWDGLYLRPNNYEKSSIIPFKAQMRKSIEEKGYVIIASIGDQQSDIEGGFALKGFKVPNPYYYLP